LRAAAARTGRLARNTAVDPVPCALDKELQNHAAVVRAEPITSPWFWHGIRRKRPRDRVEQGCFAVPLSPDSRRANPGEFELGHAFAVGHEILSCNRTGFNRLSPENRRGDGVIIARYNFVVDMDGSDVPETPSPGRLAYVATITLENELEKEGEL
jgi:hypothetical protein